MDLYFIKATYTNNYYKISDFFIGDSYYMPVQQRLSLNIKANDGATRIVGVPNIINNQPLTEYTHVIAPTEEKIYLIYNINYLNQTQSDIELMEDAFLSQYQELKTKKIQLFRSNSVSQFFTGINDIEDTSIKHTATTSGVGVNPNALGPMVLLTYQTDVADFTLNFGDLKNFPTVGNYANKTSLLSSYPNVTTTNPYTVPYYLKFAYDNTLEIYYQAVYVAGTVEWCFVPTEGAFQYGASPNFPRAHGRYQGSYNYHITNIGDISTVNILLPLDANIVQQGHYHEAVVDEWISVETFIPSFYHLETIPVAGLMSIKIVPPEILNMDVGWVSHNEVAASFYSVPSLSPQITYYDIGSYYKVKRINSSNCGLITSQPGNSYNWNPTPTATLLVAKSFKDVFTFDYSSLITGVTSYEPFKKYMFYLWGEMIEMPARYLTQPFNVRIVVTSTDVIYEVYTDMMNIIASGRLMWFTRYSVDQLALFTANNPTYKEQFWTNQIINSLRSGLMGGFVTGGNPTVAIASAGIDAGTNITNHLFMQKGLKDKADQIYGQNDVALTMLKGFNSFLVVISPETISLNQMIDQYQLNGFPAASITTINDINASSNTVFGTCKIVSGELLEKVKNAYITRAISAILKKGVVII